MVLSACAAQGPYEATRGLIPAGSEIVVVSRLKRDSRMHRVYLQAGERMASNNLDRYTTYCFFRMIIPGGEEPPATLETDTFATGESYVVTLRAAIDDGGSTTLAASLATLPLARAAGGGGAGGDGPFFFLYARVIPLKSDAQPHVERLICERLRDPTLSRPEHYPSLAEIRRTLGEHVELRLAGVQ